MRFQPPLCLIRDYSLATTPIFAKGNYCRGLAFLRNEVILLDG